jgi:hypothetical protein
VAGGAGGGGSALRLERAGPQSPHAAAAEDHGDGGGRSGWLAEAAVGGGLAALDLPALPAPGAAAVPASPACLAL